MGRRSYSAVRAAACFGAALLIALTAPAASAATLVSKAPVVSFQAAGSEGGGVLEPGTLYPPTTHGFATLKRGSDWIQVNIETSGLPPGAYTVWWVIFNTPNGCSEGCGENDLLNPEATTAVFYATGRVIRSNGVASFVARHQLGDDLGEPGTQDVIGDGLIDPMTAEIHNVIKYHGPASDDPDTLRAQISTLLAECEQGANAVDLGAPFGVHCFDPQAVAHPTP